MHAYAWQDKNKRKFTRIKEREARTNSGVHGSGDGRVRASIGKKGKGLFGKALGVGSFFQKRRAIQAKRQQAREAAVVSYVPPEWLKDHMFKLPADAEEQHKRAMADPVLHDHRVCWMDLRRVQAVDEKHLQTGHKKRMKWLST